MYLHLHCIYNSWKTCIPTMHYNNTLHICIYMYMYTYTHTGTCIYIVHVVHIRCILFMCCTVCSSVHGAYRHVHVHSILVHTALDLSASCTHVTNLSLVHYILGIHNMWCWMLIVQMSRHVHMYIGINMYILYMCACVHTPLYTSRGIYMYMYMYMYMCVYVHIYMYMYTVSTLTHVYMYMCLVTCNKCMCMYRCMYPT